MNYSLSIYKRFYSFLAVLVIFTLFPFTVNADPYPPTLTNGATHYAPVAWPDDVDWKPYSRFGGDINDPRTSDPSNGGTRPQNYVNIASSCIDENEPSVYYYLYQDPADAAKDVIMFRWRVEQIANTYATGPSAGSYSSGDAWGSALWTVLFDIDGDGVRDLAAHLDGSSGSPAEPIDRIFGIYGNIPTQSIDYTEDPNIKLIGHNPTAFTDSGQIVQFDGNAAAAASQWPNGADEIVWDYGTTRSSVNVDSPCKEYYIDYQIPMGLIDASSFGGPTLTRETPISMLFCTANSLNNPFQKDCAINATWIADPNKPAPFGDYISFEKTEPYEQPIVDDIGSSGCNPVTLTAKVKDSIAIVNGEAVPSVASVDFYYYRDNDGNGLADDEGEWHFAASGTRIDFVNWTATWNSSALFQGQYLIGVKSTDDPTKVDANMDTNGTTNVTFSYLTQSQVDTLATSTPKPTNETWWANPEITGVKSIALAVNICGTAPTITKTASVSNVLASEDINFTIVIDNFTGFDINVSQIQDMLPEGFSYKQTISLKKEGIDINYAALTPGATGTISWIFDTNTTMADTEVITLIFEATASTVSGSYNNVARADTSFGALVTSPVPVQVDSARISLSKTPDTYFVQPGDPVNYTLYYSNDSNVELTNVTLVDTLPADVTCVTYSINGETPVDCSAMGSTINMNLSRLSGLESGSVELNVIVDTTYPSASLLNTAILSVTAPDGSDINRTAESTIAVDVPVAAFTLDKTSDKDLVALNGDVTYTLTYTNYGDANATGVTITDTLPIGFTYVSATGTILDNGDGTYTWDIGTVPAGASATGSVNMVANATADPVLTSIFTGANPALNSATLTWTGPDNGSVTATKEVGVDSESCKAYYFTDILADVGSTSDQLVARETIVNAPTDINVIFTSANQILPVANYYMDPVTTQDINSSEYTRFEILIDYIPSQTLNTDFYADVYDYNPINNTKTLIQAGLTAGSNGNSQKTITMSVTNNYNIPIGHRILAEISLKSSKAATISVHINNTLSRGLLCKGLPAGLSIAKTVDTSHIATTGATTPIVYTINYANVSGTDVNNAIVVDTLPENVTFVSASPAETSIVGQVATFDVGTLASGVSGQIVINATVTAGASGTLTNTASIDSDETTPVQDRADTIIGSLSGDSAPALSITKSVDKTYISAGETVKYTLTVVNTGGTATSITVSDTIPQETYFDYVAGSITGGTAQDDSLSPVLTWTIDSLALGETATLTFEMNSSTTGIPVGVTVLENDATVSDSDYCTATSISGCTSNTVPVTISGNPNLEIIKTSSNPTPQADELITYTIEVTNSGSSDATETVVVDPIPVNVIFEGNSTTITATQGTGSFDGVNNRMVFNVGNLAAGTTATLSFQARVKSVLDAGTTTIINTAFISAGNAPEENATATISSNAAIDLTVNIGGSSSEAYPTATVDQNITSDTISVNDASQFSVDQVIYTGGQYVTITAINGNMVTLDTPVTVTVGDGIIGSVTYGVVYQNHGDADALDTNLTVILPSGILYYDAVSTPDSAPVQGTDGNVTWNLGTVGSGDSGSFQIITFPSATGSYTINTNIVSTDTVDNVEGNNSDSITTIFGGLKVEKSTSTSTVVQPSTGFTTDVNYTITVYNALDHNVSDVNVTDSLPAGFEYNTTVSIISYDINNTSTDISGSTTINPEPSQPSWGITTIPADGKVEIKFTTHITESVGAATYQNGVYTITNEANTSVTQYDELAHSEEDVTVLNPTDALIEGYIFEDKNENNIFDSGDIPYINVEVNITDDSNPSFYYTAITDGSGYFARVVAEGNWTIEHDGTDINSSLSLSTGFTNPTSVVVPAGSTIEDLNPYVVPGSQTASFTVVKATADTPTAAGQTLTYTFDVNNTGNVTLTDINLTDAKCAAAPVYSSGDADGNTSVLAVGETQVYSCTSIAVTQAEMDAGEVYNEVSVEATPPTGTTPPVEANLTTPVDPASLVPGISLEKIGMFVDENNDGYADVGETVSYEFNITNIGNVTLYDVNLTDVNAEINGISISTLVPGESDTTTYTATHTITWQDIIDGKVVNQAIVTAKDPQGNDLNDTSDDPQNPVNDDPNNDGEPDDETSTGLPIQPPTSTDDAGIGITGEEVSIDIVNNDTGGTFTLDATTVTLTPPTGATGIVTVDGDVIGFIISGEGTWSVDETTGEVTFNPEQGYVGDPTPIEYTIEDTQGNETTSEITINYPPVANDDNVTADRDEVVTLDVLANDQNTTDLLDPTTVRLIGPDGNETDTLYVLNEGTWSVDTNGSVMFDPDMDFSGDASITYVVRETNGDVSNEATITIRYPGFPIATDNLDIPITEYRPTVIDVLANGDDWGSNGPGTQIITFTEPIYGTVYLDDGGTPDDPTDDILIYTPAPDVNNITDSFTYTITDALGFTSTATVTLDVNCASSQSSDGGDALNVVSMLLLAIMTAMTGLYFVRKEERGEA